MYDEDTNRKKNAAHKSFVTLVCLLSLTKICHSRAKLCGGQREMMWLGGGALGYLHNFVVASECFHYTEYVFVLCVH